VALALLLKVMTTPLAQPSGCIGAALKARLHTLAGLNKTSGPPASEAGENVDVGSSFEPAASKQAPPAAMADTGELLVPKDKRIRDREHLAFVASQPCLVCGRRPAQAHHIRFAQPRALGLKVSDEFTVPLCNGHHDSLHQTGDERAWWARHGILDPLMLANRLWAVSHQGHGRSPPPSTMAFEDEFEDVSRRLVAQPKQQPNGGS
jgi:hypothetical protein